MDSDAIVTDLEFTILQALIWERPIGDVDVELLAVLQKRGLIRPEGEGWSITYLGHTLFIRRLAQTF